MRAKRAHRDREKTQVAVLDALADRQTEGMSVLELRSHVEVDIDRLEAALAELKDDDLIRVSENGQRTVIVPDEDVVGPDETDANEGGILDAIRRYFQF